MESNIPQWIQDINTIFGVVGFFITLYVMREVRSIRNSFRSRARLPEIVKDLEGVGSAFNKNLGDWPALKNHARSQIKDAATLVNLSTSLLAKNSPVNLKLIDKKLSLAVVNFDNGKYDDANAAWDLYSDIQSSITMLKQAVQSIKWE